MFSITNQLWNMPELKVTRKFIIFKNIYSGILRILQFPKISLKLIISQSHISVIKSLHKRLYKNQRKGWRKRGRISWGSRRRSRSNKSKRKSVKRAKEVVGGYLFPLKLGWKLIHHFENHGYPSSDYAVETNYNQFNIIRW